MKHLVLLLTLIVSLTLNASGPYVIYPTPHSQVPIPGTAKFTKTVTIVVTDNSIDEATIELAKQALEIHGLKHVVADKEPSEGSFVTLTTDTKKEPGKYDSYVLSLYGNKNGEALVIISGENTDAVFCGIITLHQMLGQHDANGAMPWVTITDFADVQNRGIIEGYYGVPYSALVTKDLFRFMACYKMNTYMYGAKSDPYHSQLWSEPYPTHITPEQERIGYLTQDMMRYITNVAHQCKVNFVWAIHPGKAFADPADNTVLERIMSKFESMYQLGVRQFGVFVDDVGVPSDTAIMRLCADRLTELQHRIDARWNTPGAAPSDTVKPLHYVPQLYAYGWVSEDKARTFYESLRSTPSKVNIYITGQNVWSVPNNNDLDLVQQWIGREVSWWWNYPCNDQDPTKLFVMDTYTNFRDETHIISTDRLERQLHGTNTVIINPMQQGELSKIALFSVADYTWNNRDFNCHNSWEDAIPAALNQEMAGAFRRIAPFLCYYDSDAMDYYIVRYKESLNNGRPTPQALINLLTQVNNDCHTLMQLPLSSIRQSDSLFYEDLRPWLLRLEAMSAEAVALLKGENPPAIDYDNDPRFQFSILSGMGNEISLQTRTAEPAAQSLEPFITWLRNQEK
ncbi:MAG: beta-N-acetylglucosaminidase domain-containing protein [Muribaculaceae bacterium]|nr:beta-N-acetylglucosaminidase domain-containing protein [Muribaculaceae bacterium]